MINFTPLDLERVTVPLRPSCPCSYTKGFPPAFEQPNPASPLPKVLALFCEAFTAVTL